MSDTPVTPRRPREATRAAWAERVTRFKEAGLTVLDFCRAEGIPSQSFYYWKVRAWRNTSPVEEQTPSAR